MFDVKNTSDLKYIYQTFIGLGENENIDFLLKLKDIIKEMDNYKLSDYLFESIKSELSDYLGFDVNELLFNDDIYIFGGALRSCISKQRINDIDIVTLPRNCDMLGAHLNHRKFTKISNGMMEDVYKELKIIHEPHTYMLNYKRVQIIRPVISNLVDVSDRVKQHEAEGREALQILLKNVDFSCNGLCMNRNGLYEVVEGALVDIKNKELRILPDNLMLQRNMGRLFKRLNNFKQKGWDIKNMDVLLGLNDSNEYDIMKVLNKI